MQNLNPNPQVSLITYVDTDRLPITRSFGALWASKLKKKTVNHAKCKTNKSTFTRNNSSAVNAWY
jgi:hypothetical protein